ncbi:MAG: bifunctional diguanylate cyclase/phosphodiesterase [Gammaproteobacteria bacterium]|nr:bifunctional diguanylate cyclase/phosphodiesterase [Gammaproteobacteria bacterium]
MTKPIATITKNLENVNNETLESSGSSDVIPMQNTTVEEIIALESGFQRMFSRIKSSFQSLAENEQKLKVQTLHDSLTGLPNRAYFEEEAAYLVSMARRHHRSLALMFFDLNGFKKINDSFGHLVGDILLKEVASNLKETVRESDFVARISGDEFIVLSNILEREEEIYTFVKRILNAFKEPFKIDGHTILCNPSIGVSFYPKAKTVKQLLKYADLAMYEAKKQKLIHGSVCFYTKEMAEKYSRADDIESNLSDAIKQKELSTIFQPVVSTHRAHENEIEVEALVRWNSKTLGWVSPDEFIPIAESSQLINEVTKNVLDDCSDLYFSFKDNGFEINKIAINLSASQFSNSAFTEMLIDWVKQTGMNNEVICIELTERQLIDNAKTCSKQINKLRNNGFKIALDDFGTGYSSLSHLLDLPIDILKIDRVLIDKVDSNSLHQALVAGIVEMSHRLGLDVIAEGVEREEELDRVIMMGCDAVQGYYFSKPLDTQALLEFYKNNLSIE